ncbi:hypothetical protein [Prosthecobacter vanneervenii]|uniref:Uncharacterized protein n=1 Tax=Prosthecobacter vanneervenii TaxID=48466 RepID=A0A7W7Y8V4_9BACT|nr:hypothetical protein [Prosthecobacter vanneervenii]MBB5031557.1 hypothetical protein [Prosthecobacter vanneervenii]
MNEREQDENRIQKLVVEGACYPMAMMLWQHLLPDSAKVAASGLYGSPLSFSSLEEREGDADP